MTINLVTPLLLNRNRILHIPENKNHPSIMMFILELAMHLTGRILLHHELSYMTSSVNLVL